MWLSAGDCVQTALSSWVPQGEQADDPGFRGSLLARTSAQRHSSHASRPVNGKTLRHGQPHPVKP